MGLIVEVWNTLFGLVHVYSKGVTQGTIRNLKERMSSLRVIGQKTRTMFFSTMSSSVR